MGQKVNPVGMRIGINKDWDATWFPASKKDIAVNLLEDSKLRTHIIEKYEHCAISRVAIERHDVRVIVNIYTGQPGRLIGQKGAGIDLLKKQLSKIAGAKQVEVNVKEVKNPDTDAALVAQSVAQQLEKRASWRRTMKNAISRAMKSGVKGIKVMVGGRLDGADIARSEFYHEGVLPLHTLRSDIDYATAEALTTFGIIGVKVWICHGEILGKKRRETSVERSERKFVKPMTNRDGERFQKRDFNPNFKKQQARTNELDSKTMAANNMAREPKKPFEVKRVFVPKVKEADADKGGQE